MEVKKEPSEDSQIDVSNSSGSKDRGKTLPEEAFNNFLQGKRHMLVQDYSFAVQSLATACELYVKHFGELAIECGEVYFLYGKALFRLSQQQAGILGGALNEGSNEEENSSESEKENENDNDNENEDENENESEKNSDGEEGEDNETEGEKDEKEPSESTDSPPAVLDEGSSEVKVKVEPPESVDGTVTIKQEPEENCTTVDQTGQSEDGSKGEKEKEENQECEEDDLELAWNTLETAKSIFKRKDTVEAQLKVAEILLLLAEISMESDNNANAINDLKECLEIQKKHLQPDDRVLAETYYQMGLALMLDKMYPEALKNFRATQQILELRKENLEKTPVDEADGTFAKADCEAEISDLTSILVDIKEKIDDTEELICNKKKEQEESSFSEAGGSGSSNILKGKDEKSTNSKPVSNITHLLKRKKPDEGTSEDNAKRIKTSGVLNGDSKVTAPTTSNVEN